MDSYEFSIAEIAAVKKEFPKLQFTSPDTWEGTVDFYATHKGYAIRGSFDVLIKIPTGYPEKIPIAYDTGGSAKTVAKKYNKKVKDLHCDPKDNSICLCVRQEESKNFPPGATMVSFIDTLVTPYFYGLEYYKERGKWPWREYSHGGLGILEYHAEDTSIHSQMDITKLASFLYSYSNKELKKCRRAILNPLIAKCICGSNLQFESCYNLAWAGLMRFARNAEEMHLSPKKLLIKVDKHGRLKKRY
jgi:hypothetical protein